MGEFELIARIASLTRAPRGDVRVGIGDDAAVVAVPAGRELALATDTLVEGIHFPRGADPADIGYKALAVNLSDLAAMGAAPAWALLALTLPESDSGWVAAFAGGFAGLAREYEIALVGGDVTRGPLTVTVQVAGTLEPHQRLARRGATPGDEIYVTGTLGDAAAGLAVVQNRLDAGEHADYLRRRLHRPAARVAAGQALVGLATAAIDLSDGLGADLAHLSGPDPIGADIELDALPTSPALKAVAAGAARWAFQFAGDDYELCFTVPAGNETRVQQDLACAGCPVTRVGRITASPGLRCFSEGREVAAPAGWRHFHA